MPTDSGTTATTAVRASAWHRLPAAYVAVVTTSVVVIVMAVRLGESWFQPAATVATRVPGTLHTPASSLSTSPLAHSPLATLILQLLVIVAAALVFRRVAHALGQPPVVGEVAAGLMLGPSGLGQIWPGAMAALFPPASMATLQATGQIGIILYMFVVGTELNTTLLRRNVHSAVAISHFSIIAPCVLGVVIAFPLYESYAPDGVHFTAFALFMGVAMSITAFPVLARVLEERGISGTRIGTTALACAAVDDISAWILLAFVVALVTAGSASSLLSTLFLVAAFLMAMIYLVRPLLNRLLSGSPQTLGPERLALVFGVVLGGALTTEMAGVHALFGAFVAGTVMPVAAHVRQQLRERIETLSAAVFLPVFFAFTGLRVHVGLLNNDVALAVAAGILLVAITGKLAGGMLAARYTGFGWHDAFLLGVLMNTRGLMELVALNVGYDLGVLSPTLFTMMVLMALITTAMTCPLMDVAAVARAYHARMTRRTPASRTLV